MASSTRSGNQQTGVPAELSPIPVIGGTMAAYLRQAGINPADVNQPHIPHHVKVDWDELCVYETKDKRTTASPQLVITRLDWQPDAEQRYPGYKGLVLCEFVTELGDEQYVTHAMTYADTGEYLPLSSWLKSITVPAACRFGRIETSKREQFVIRPLPLDIEVL